MARPFGVGRLPEALDTGINNSGDDVASTLEPNEKLVWLVRHGLSTGNEGKHKAIAADAGTGSRTHQEQYEKSHFYIDAPLAEEGQRQAMAAQKQVYAWQAKPELVVCSPMTRAIQTAAIVFRYELSLGVPLIVNPQLREFWSNNNENMGRPLPELRRCPLLQSLEQWGSIEKALSEEACKEWQTDWDISWANGANGAWQLHVEDGHRVEAFSEWLSNRRESRIAVVCHWGSINNFLNRQPWCEGQRKKNVGDLWQSVSWPTDGIVRSFNMKNCGWVAVPFMGAGAPKLADDASTQPLCKKPKAH